MLARTATLAALTIVAVMPLRAAEQIPQRDGDQVPLQVPPAALSGLLRVDRVRIEAPPPEIDSEAALLKFDLFNAGETPVTSITVEISIREKGDGETPGRRIVHPFSIRGDTVLEAGYTINFGLLLRNLSPDCRCVPKIDVVSVRALTR